MDNHAQIVFASLFASLIPSCTIYHAIVYHYLSVYHFSCRLVPFHLPPCTIPPDILYHFIRHLVPFLMPFCTVSHALLYHFSCHFVPLLKPSCTISYVILYHFKSSCTIFQLKYLDILIRAFFVQYRMNGYCRNIGKLGKGPSPRPQRCIDVQANLDLCQ